MSRLHLVPEDLPRPPNYYDPPSEDDVPHEVKSSTDESSILTSGASQWPEFVQFPADFAPAEFPLDALPPTFSAIVNDVRALTQAPPALIAASVLGAASTACQGIVNVARDGDLRGPVSLFIVIAAESGERKTEVERHTMGATVRFQSRAAEEARPQLDKYQAQMRKWTAKGKGLERAIEQRESGGKARSGDNRTIADISREIDKHEAEKPRASRYPRITCSDITQEELVHSLAHVWPSRSITSAEAGAVLGSFSMNEKNAVRTVATWNQMWSGAASEIERRTSESSRVEAARLTITLQAQPAILNKFIAEQHNVLVGEGFFARTLFCFPPTTAGTRKYIDRPILRHGLDTFNARIAELLEKTVVDEKGRLVFLPDLKISASAFRAWVDYYDEIESKVAPGQEFAGVRDIAGKSADNLARIAAIFSIFSAGPTADIDLRYVESAQRIAKYFLSESRRYFDAFIMKPEIRDAAELEAKLVAFCRNHGKDQITSTEAINYAPNRMRTKGNVESAIDTIVKHGRARRVDEGAGKNKRRFIQIHPALILGKEDCE